MKYTVEVDRENCISCGVCYNSDPTILNHVMKENQL
ncbi:hypothetical protein FJY84_04170 [Candidatus Bathyarchaeota archaeon]|nr:hypothetical protein [Candidatus Bathyarchaeota archaeon]